jgi:hypothetical protein
MAKRILICGSRFFSDIDAIRSLVATFPPDTVVIHGAAPGADTYAGVCARQAGLEVEAYPADWKQYNKAAGPIRNKQMLDEGKPDIVYAFPGGPLDKTTGTKDMVRQARAAGVETVVFE